MKRLILVVLVVVVGIVGVGFFRGWFTVNEAKIQEDEERAKEEVRELVQEVKAKAAEHTDKAQERP
jgi:beta-lactam-binding protein with PASTA domain